jgi:uncharacterized caspase-like protein
MKQQTFLIILYLCSHSFGLIAQPQPKNKEDFDKVWGRPKEATTSPLFENEEVSPENGDVKIYAVVVGVSQYSAMPKLEFTDDDARLFFAHLASREGGDLPREQIKLLLEEDATYVNVTLALRQMAVRADGNDVIIFYFSGHGLSQAFLPFDFDGYNNLLKHEDLLNILKSSHAKHKLCIADACNSGGMDQYGTLASKGATSVQIRHFYDQFEATESGTALFMSSSAKEVSLEAGQLHHGVFTHFLLEGMSGRADYDEDGIVEIKELFSYVHHYVVEYTEGAQSPVLTGNYDDNLPVAIRN